MDDSGTVTVIDAGTQEASDTTPADWVISLAGSGAYLRVNFLKTATATAIYCSAKVTLVEACFCIMWTSTTSPQASLQKTRRLTSTSDITSA